MKDIAATFMFFTRLPLWRLRWFDVPKECFARVINYWAVVGWLTGGVMASVLWLAAHVFPYPVAVALAMLSRVLLTGALHEDGLADCADGFGGGDSRERILAIMKDSHTGVYGVVALVFYFLLFHLFLSHLPPEVGWRAMLIADPLCKFVASQTTRFLPYARRPEDGKLGVAYAGTSAKAWVTACFFGFVPLVLTSGVEWLLAAIFPFAVFAALIGLMKRRLGGYTGDCCGAMFLMCELSFYAGYMVVVFFANLAAL
jgi:adenosylcobinamide-GDP ribazoletransferase